MSIPPSKKSVFRERLAYARWVRQLRGRGEESDRQLATAAGIGYDWLQKWKKRDDAPDDRIRAKKLTRYLEVDEEWFLDNEGEAPRLDLWVEWIAAFRGATAKTPAAAAYRPPPLYKGKKTAPPKRGRASGE